MHQLRIDRHQLRKIALIGIPAGLQGCLFSFSNIMIQQSINSLGTIAVAAATAAMNFEYYLYFIANSLSQTATTWIGQNYGAGKLDRCRTIARWSLIWGAGCTLLVSLVLVAFSRPLLHIFTTNAAVIAMARIRIWVISSTECLNAVVEAFTGILRAYGHSLVPTIISLLGIVGLRLAWIGSVFQVYPDFGVLSACYPVSWAVTSIALCIAYRWIQRQLSHSNKNFAKKFA
jgi:Na+-driven multidrug efflux pump